MNQNPSQSQTKSSINKTISHQDPPKHRTPITLPNGQIVPLIQLPPEPYSPMSFLWETKNY